MKTKKYLTEDEAEGLKAACKTEDERAVVREMLETGITLKEALKRREEWRRLNRE